MSVTAGVMEGTSPRCLDILVCGGPRTRERNETLTFSRHGREFEWEIDSFHHLQEMYSIRTKSTNLSSILRSKESVALKLNFTEISSKCDENVA